MAKKQNDECMRCKDKECHDGENLCNYATQKNSFYKNPRLYKGIEVIRLPTYKELEKEATEFEENYTVYEAAKRKDGTGYAKKVCKVTVKEAYLAGAEPREKRIEGLENENKHIYERMTMLDKVLEEKNIQIEKMKCCPNCDFMFRDGNCYYDKECKNKDHWKLRG